MIKVAAISSLFFTSVPLDYQFQSRRELSEISDKENNSTSSQDFGLRVLEINYLISRTTKKSSADSLIKIRDTISAKVSRKKLSEKEIVLNLSHGIIESLEGEYHEKAYNDGYGTYTIGHGVTYISDKRTGKERRVKKSDILPKKIGKRLQWQLVAKNYDFMHGFLVQSRMDRKISVYGKAALISYIYNIGIERFSASETARLIKNGKVSKAIKSMKSSFVTSKGVSSEGLVSRREVESLLLSLSVFNPYQTLLTYKR